MSNELEPTAEFVSYYGMNYLQMVDALNKKYGKVPEPYFKKSKTGNVYPNSKIKRGKEGLEVHHVAENKFLLLSNVNNAVEAGLEYQEPKYLVYANKIEHALLHAKIIVEYNGTTDRGKQVGWGGLYSQLLPFLNDVFSGWIPRNKTEFNDVKPFLVKIGNELVFNKQEYMNYLTVIQYLIDNKKLDTRLYSSFNVKSGAWSIEKDIPLFKVFKKLGGPFFDDDILRKNANLIKSNIVSQNHPEKVETDKSHWARWYVWTPSIILGIGIFVILVLGSTGIIW